MVLGLNELDAKRLLEQYGENRFVSPPKPDIVEIFRSNFSAQMIMLLIALALLALVDAEVAVTAFIFVIAIAGLETYRDIRVNKAVSEIQTAYIGETTVIREGVKKRIPTSYVVPGDIVVLEAGDRIPADGMLIEGECRVDESVFERGVFEKRAISEDERSEIIAFRRTDPSVVFAGTFVIDAPTGGCLMRVEKTGTATKFAKSPSPPQKRPSMFERIEKVVANVNSTVLVFAFILLIILLFFGVRFIDAFVIATAVTVAGMPQYVMSTAQAAFYLTLHRISKMVAVRKTDIIEKVANTTLIVTEKIKALTRGEYTVKKLWIDGVDVTVSGEGWTAEGDFEGLVSFATLDFTTRLIAAGTEAAPIYEGEKLKISGRLDEAALIVLAMKNRQSIQNIRFEYPSLKRTVNSDNTVLSTVKTPQGVRQTIYIGPADIVTRRCAYIMLEGKQYKIDKNMKREIERKAIEMAADGFQVTAIAFVERPEKAKDTKEKETRVAKKKKAKDFGEDFTLLCLAGIYDPPRKEVKDLIAQCKSAGIDVVILTEESETTAISFAREIGILDKGKRAIIAEELKYMKSDERRRVIEKTAVFGRASPQEEVMVINELKNMGHKILFIESVGNDPGAMKAADVSLVLESSSDILKFNAAGILKGDDAYGALKTVEEAKAFTLNVERIFYTIFALDFAILFFVLLSAVWSGGQTLTVLQILLVNAIADSLGGIGLARERVPESSLASHLQRWKFPSTVEFTFAFLLSVYIAAVTLGIASVYASAYPGHYLSVAFATLVMCFIAVMLCFASLRLSLIESLRAMMKESNKPAITAAIIAFIVLLAVLYSPLNALFATSPLSLTELATASAAALSICVIVEIKKALIH